MTNNEENKEDLKNQKETDSDQSTEEETTQTSEEEKPEEVTEDLKSPEQIEEKADELLADGTQKDKDITVPKPKLDDLTEKSKLFDEFSPLLEKLKNKPELVDQILGAQEGETPEDRIKRLEEESYSKRRIETHSAVVDALKIWPNFEKSWSDISPEVRSMIKRGVNVRDAIQRAFFAKNPSAMSNESRLFAQEVVSEQGKMSSTSGQGFRVKDESDDFQLDPRDKEFAEKAGIDPEKYKKHAPWLKQTGIDQL